MTRVLKVDALVAVAIPFARSVNTSVDVAPLVGGLLDAAGVDVTEIRLYSKRLTVILGRRRRRRPRGRFLSTSWRWSTELDDGTVVTVGQVWADKNPLFSGRTFEITGIDDRCATIEVLTPAPNRQAPLTQKSRPILLRRLRKREGAYELLVDNPPS